MTEQAAAPCPLQVWQRTWPRPQGVCQQAKSNHNNCAMFWRGDCSSARELGLIRTAAAAGKSKCNPFWSIDMDWTGHLSRSLAWEPRWHPHVALVVRSSCTSPSERRYHVGYPQRSQAQAKIKQLGECPAPLLMPEQQHTPLLVIPSRISSWEKTFPCSHFSALTATCRCWVESQAVLVVITALRVISVSEYNVCLIICNLLNHKLHSSCSYSMP